MRNTGLRNLVVFLSLAAGVVAVGYLAATLAADWSTAARQVASLDPVPFALGLAVLLSHTWLVALIWRDLLALFCPRIGLGSAYALIHVAAVGKYLPGKIWAFGGLAVLAANAGIPLRAAAAASTALILVVLAGGALVGGAAFLVWRLGGSLATAAVVAVALVAGPWALARLLVGPPSTIAEALARANGGWLMIALGNWLIAAAIHPVAPGDALPLLASAAAAWLAGLSAFALPAGLGVREAVQALALAETLPSATAVTFALLVRLALALGDVIAALTGLLLLGGRAAPVPAASFADVAKPAAGPSSATDALAAQPARPLAAPDAGPRPTPLQTSDAPLPPH